MGRKVDSDKHFKEAQRAFARGGAGGDQHMFRQQAANPRDEGGSAITGKRDVRGPGRKFPEGGGEDHAFGGHAMPARPGVTASTQRPGRSSTRNYGK